MIKPFIKLRKKTWLPLKWFFSKRNIVEGLVMPPKIEIYERYKSVKESLAQAEIKVEQNREELALLRGQNELLKWLVEYGSKETTE